MAVQKNRKTRAKRNMRRSHDKTKNPALTVDPMTGETRLYHHIGPDGYYKGREIIAVSEKLTEEDEE